MSDEVYGHDQYNQVESDCQALVGQEEVVLLNATRWYVQVPEAFHWLTAEDANYNLNDGQ